MKFSIKDFFSKFDQIRRKLRIWSDLLKKSLMENYIFLGSSFLQVEEEYEVISKKNQSPKCTTKKFTKLRKERKAVMLVPQ